MEKISTGIVGLDNITGGGFNKNSVTVLIGDAGTGKTISCLSFLKKGLEAGSDCIYISLEEDQSQLVREAVEMGWKSISDYINDEKLVFIEAAGKDFSDFVKNELPALVENYQGNKTRIVVDPLIPLLWSSNDKYIQRELVSALFGQIKKIGTVLVTVEDHSRSTSINTSDLSIPLFLSDAAIKLTFVGLGTHVSRMVKVMKFRSSVHSQISHPYTIIKGLGLVIHAKDDKSSEKELLYEKLCNILENDSKNLGKTFSDEGRQLLKEIESSQLGVLSEKEFCTLIRDFVIK